MRYFRGHKRNYKTKILNKKYRSSTPPFPGAQKWFALGSTRKYESYEYNIAQPFYEHFLLNFPKRVIHDNNLCDAKQITLMNKYSNKSDNAEFDDRWSKLKDLKNDK